MNTFVVTFFIVLGIYMVGMLVLGFVKAFLKHKREKNKQNNDAEEEDKD